MKSLHGSVGSQSCSCTSCLYRSGSENPSLRRYISGGSKIDRLYLGKYIPLRERKLLNRLVRTRAVYDGIRNQLLLGSSASLGTLRSNLSEEIENSSAILRIVDLVDKGKLLKQNGINLDECCSCCDCGPNNVQEHEPRPRRRRYGRKNYVADHSMSGTSMISRHRDAFRTNGFRFKPKSIRSEPCTCITKLSEVLKRRSQEISRRLRHESSKLIPEEPSLMDYDILKTHGKRKSLRRTYQRMKYSKTRLMQSMGESVRKIGDSKDKLKDYIDDETRRSIDKIKDTKKKIKYNLKSGGRKSEDQLERLELNIFPIQKDSIAKYKELLERRRRHYLNQLACKWECYPDECEPKECFRILKLRRRRKKYQEVREDSEILPNNLQIENNQQSVKVMQRKRQKYYRQNGYRNLRNEAYEIPGITNSGGKGQALKKEVIIQAISRKILENEKKSHISAKPQVNTNIKRNETNQLQSRYVNTLNADDRNGNGRKVKIIKENMPSEIYGTRKEQSDNLKHGTIREPLYINSSIESIISIPKEISRSLSQIYTRAKKLHLENKSNVTRELGKHISSSKTFSMPDVTKVDQRPTRLQTARKKPSSRKRDRIHAENSIRLTKNKPSRQAVKINSSFSFSIEFSRDKKKTRKVTTLKKDKIKNTGMIQSETNSNTKAQKSKREQPSVKSLKRCFCTLKLMTKKNQVNGSKIVPKSVATPVLRHKSSSTLGSNEIQLKVEDQTQTKNLPSRLDACPSGICVPNECDPLECLKVIRNHKIKDRSTGENVKTKKSKSVSTYSLQTISNIGTVNTTPRRRAKTKIKQKIVAQRSLKGKQTKEPESNKQAVRINSSFSFNIQFKKINYNDNVKPTVNDKIRPHGKVKQSPHTATKNLVRNKQSHFNTSMIKSRFSLTKHRLRKCICTLKLGQTSKRKLKTKTNQIIQAENLNVPLLESHVVSRSVNTGTERKIQHKLLPYECEPGICVPGECDPYMCLKINKRQISKKKQLSKFSNTTYRRSKSTSSVTSQIPHKKAKLIQSSDFPSRKHKQKKNILETTLSSPERQIVRVGSSFSFNIEFYKDKRNYKMLPQNRATNQKILKKNRTFATPYHKDQGSRGITKHIQNSVSMLVKNNFKNSFTGPSRQRILKLQKPSNAYWDQNVAVDSIIPTKKIYNNDKNMINRSTRTKPVKLKIRHSMKPYECEPFVCIPGDCNPYECLQRIQKRKLQSKQLGTETDRLKSASIMTQKSSFRSKGALVKSNISSKIRLNNNITSKPKRHQTSHRQAVQIGSNFSFNIEFQKIKRNSPKVIDIHRIPHNLTNKPKHNGTLSNIKPKTDFLKMERYQKSIGIRPILKRCFCTLKLQGNTEEKIRNNEKQSRTFQTYKDHSKIYTVSKITIDRTKDTKTIHNVNDDTFQNGYSEIEKGYYSCTILSNSKLNFNVNSLTGTSFQSNKALSQFDVNTIVTNMVLPTFNSKLHHENKWSESFLLMNRCKFSQSRSHKSLNSDFGNKNRLQLLKQHYCAMNIHIPEKSKNLYKKSYTLQPYECEPGVCVPYRCNPYECEKLIMKRFMKGIPNISGTGIKSRSISNSVAQSLLSFKKKLQSTQIRHKKERSRPIGIKYKSHPNGINKGTVRVGSSLNFNVEFYKGKVVNGDHSGKNISPVKRPRTISKSKHFKSTGIQKQVAMRRDHDAQSIITTQNKGSGRNQMPERCFCTLKLQKRGRHHKNDSLSFNKVIRTPSNINIDAVSMMTDSSQNTDHLPPLKLLPYECEPQVCKPRECDPHDCLQRIKKRYVQRKDFGAGISPIKTSKTSMTTKYQVRTHTQSHQINPKVNRKTKALRFVQSKPHRRVAPLRQAVRIGSNFSFNIDFFKENSDNMPTVKPILQQTKIRHGANSTATVMGIKQNKKKLRHIGSQDIQLLQDKNSQIGNMLSHASTMTASLLKRCFCTSKMHQKELHINKPLKSQTFEGKELHVNDSVNIVETKGSRIKNIKPFLHRCFCALKLRDRKEGKHIDALTKTNASTETENYYIHGPARKMAIPPENNKKYRLESYECEPGVCIPGQCDPFDCENLIRSRILPNDSKAVITDIPKRKSMSSSFKSLKTSKFKEMPLNLKSVGAPRNRQAKTVKRNLPYKSGRPIKQLSSSRQVVRVGSQLSFNIEFYKDRSIKTDEVQAAAKAIKNRPGKTSNKRIKQSQTENQVLKLKNRGVKGLSMLRYDQDSQVSRETQDQATGVGHLLKRCFCTLKLQKQYDKQIEMSNQGTDTPAFKEVPTLYSRGVMTEERKWKLKPYECEPNSCVPYDCNPYECDKLIKKRLIKEAHKSTTIMKNELRLDHKLEPYECEPNTCLPGKCNPHECAERIRLRKIKSKESGTLTKRFKSKSVTSGVRSSNSSKPRKTQSAKRKQNNRMSKSGVSKCYHQKKLYNSSFVDSTRKTVRIGSGLSFDIEFYKNKSQNKADVYKPHKITRRNRNSITSFTTHLRNKKIQQITGVRDIDSQVLHNMQDTGVNPVLKRCFCTLKLKKSMDASNQLTKIRRFTSSKFGTISKAARDKNVYLATFTKLLPYECEPGLCIRDECNPYECDKRIKKRLLLSQTTETDRQLRYSRNNSTISTKRNAMSNAKTKRKSHPRPIYHKRDFIDLYPENKVNERQSSSCRIGSCLNFNIEFYKKRDGTDFNHNHEANSKGSKQGKTHSTSINSNKAKRRHKLQTSQSKTESKSIGTDPLLKRCFCTLALQRNLDPLVLKNKRLNTSMQEKILLNKEKGVGTRMYIPILDPHECEPNICISDECDPYECYERIKLRRMRDHGIDTQRFFPKYAVSICKEAATQFDKRKQRKENTPAKSKKSEQVSHEAPRLGNITRFGSNISFNIEFYKQKNAGNKLTERLRTANIVDNASLLTSKIYKQAAIARNHQNQLSYSKNKYGTNEVQVDSLQTAARGTGIGAFLKRCICSLSFRNNRNTKTIAQNKENDYFSNSHKSPKTPQENQVRGQTTKDKRFPKEIKPQIKHASKKHSKQPNNQGIEIIRASKYSSKFIKHDYEPNVCIPNECDPYECLEKIKKHQLRPQSRRAAAYVRPSKMSTCSKISKFVPRRSKRVSSTVKRIRQISHSQSQEVQTIVEEPRFVHMFDNPKTHTTRYGSNINFNIEFYKKNSQFPGTKVHFFKEAEYKKPRLGQTDVKKCIDIEYKPEMKHEAVSGYNCGVRTCGAQVDPIRTKNKAAGVPNIVKRCFCTVNLQKDESHYVPQKVHKVIKVNRFVMDKTWITSSYKLKQKIITKHFNNRNVITDRKNDLKNKIQAQETTKDSDTSEMQTIYPYSPSKFHKHISKTGILRKKDIKKPCMIVKSPILRQKINKHIRKPTINSFKSLTANIFKRIFMPFRNKTKLYVEKNDMLNESMHSKNTNRKPLSALKSSKSERATKFKISRPKKVLSLKGTKLSDENRSKYNFPCQSEKIVYSHYQCGDINKKPLISGKNYMKSPHSALKRDAHYTSQSVSKSKILIDSPFENNKIVQMTLLHRKSMKEKTKFGEINKPQYAAAQTEFDNKISQKCSCSMNEKKIKKKLKQRDTKDRFPEIKDNKMNMSKKSLFASGDISYQTTSSKEAKINKKNIKNKSMKKIPTQSGDAPITEKDYVNMKKIKYKKDKNESCPCYSNKILKKGNNTKLGGAFNNVGESGIQVKEVKLKSKSNSKIKNAELKRILTKYKGVSDLSKIGEQYKIEHRKTDNRNILAPFRNNKLDVSTKYNNEINDHNLINKTNSKNRHIFSKLINKQNVLNKLEIDKYRINTGEQIKNHENKTDAINCTFNDQKQNKTVKKKNKKGKSKKNNIQNNEDVQSKTSQLKQRKKKDNGVKLSIKPKGNSNAKREVIVPDYSLLKHTKINKICTCGSKKCTKELKQLIAKQKLGKIKSKAPCVCGTDVCTTETWRKSLRHGQICECQKVLKEIEKAEEDKRRKEEERRNRLKADMIYDKKQKKEQKYKRKLRMKQERRLDKEAEKYMNNSDTALVVDSLVDVLRLGFRAGADVAECTSKAVINPRRSLRGLKMAARDPQRALSNMKSSIEGSGLFSTARRIKLRFRAMKSVQSLKSRLEENEFTGVLYNMRDKKARERIKKRRMQKKREKKSEKAETDFECSPFMASLRKKPCLAVYYLCPWFYPHFLSMLNLWKQFTDVLLFLLAVVVWSPFILCLEICRAMVCCFFCTG